jgi:hypothetical protein
MQKTKQQKETPLTTPFRFIYQKKKKQGKHTHFSDLH